MTLISMEKLHGYIKDYKKALRGDDWWDQERYKWEAVKCFQDNWNIDADNFAEMFEKSILKTNNLLHSYQYFPDSIIKELNKYAPEKVREIFRNLFDEQQEIVGRINAFMEKAKTLCDQYNAGKNNYQDVRACFTYLWLRYPDKYYIYKVSILRRFGTALQCEFKFKKGKSYVDGIKVFLQMYDIICDELNKDNDFKNLLASKIDGNCYVDSFLKTATIDLSYFVSNESKDYWMYSPGEQAEKWDEFYQKGIMACSFSGLTDFRKYDTKQAVVEAFRRLSVDENSHKNDATAVWDFCNEMNIGDFVFAKNGRNKIIGVGIVDSDYEFDENRQEYNHVRRVKWIKKGDWVSPDKLPIKTLTKITKYNKLIKELDEVLKLDEEWLPIVAEYDQKLTVNDWVELLQNKEIIENDGVFLLSKVVNREIPFTWKELAKEYGTTTQQFSSLARRLGERIIYKDGEPKNEDDKSSNLDDEYKCITVAFQYRERGNTNQKEWKLRDEVKEAWDMINSGPKPNLVPDSQKENFPLNQILYGPPGTGKTYNTVIEALKIVEPGLVKIADGKCTNYKDVLKRFNELKFNPLTKEGRIGFVTFHQSFSYEEFVEGIRPSVINGQVTYGTKAGIFKEICMEAKNNKDKPYVLIIDEINRGNISKIFGELITLLEADKRETFSVILPYSQEEFRVPENLYVIGTMNTADRSIAAMDIALRRRFSFKEMMPREDLVPKFVPAENTDGIPLRSIFANLNKRIGILLDRDHQLGHSYFMECKTVEKLKDTWFDKILPLLNEYFYGDWEKLAKVVPGFVDRGDVPKDLQEYGGEDEYYSFVIKENCADFVKKMQAMPGGKEGTEDTGAEAGSTSGKGTQEANSNGEKP